MTGIPKEVYLDTNVIIDLIALECLVEVLGTPSIRFHATENVLAEVTYPDEKRAVEYVLAYGLLNKVKLTEIKVLLHYAELKQVLGDGEAATLAVTSHEKAFMASNEKGRFAKEAETLLGSDHIYGTADLLVEAILQQRLSLVELEQRLQNLTAIAEATQIPRREAHLARVVDLVTTRLSKAERLEAE